MKVMAIGNITRPPTEDQSEQVLSREVPHTLQLYLGGKLEQFWFRQDRPGTFFLFDVDSLDDAKTIANDLPLVKEGFMTYEFFAVGPLAPLGRLIQRK